MAVCNGDAGECDLCEYALAGVHWNKRWSCTLCVVCEAVTTRKNVDPTPLRNFCESNFLVNAMIDGHGTGYRAEVERHLLGESEGSGTYGSY